MIIDVPYLGSERIFLFKDCVFHSGLPLLSLPVSGTEVLCHKCILDAQPSVLRVRSSVFLCHSHHRTAMVSESLINGLALI